jgi:hypothetical protein
MTSSTVFPKGEPLVAIGDLDLVEAQAEYYTADEATHTLASITEYCECQSRAHHSVMNVFGQMDDRKIDYMRQYGLRFSFHNYTGLDVVVVDRLGLPVTIKPESRKNARMNVFLIRKEMYFDSDVIAKQAYLNVKSLGKTHGAELTKILPALGQDIAGHRFGRCISLEYEISEEDIRNGDGRLYHLPTDMVVSFMSATDTIRHPCSPEFVQDYQREFVPNFPTGVLDVRTVFRYISANPKATPKYLRVGEHVFMLSPEKSEAAKLVTVYVGKDKVATEVEASEYLEMLYPAFMDAMRENVRGWRCHRVTIEQARESFGVYDTLEDAKNPIIVAEREKREHKEALAAKDAKHGEVVANLNEKIREMSADEKRLKATVDELRQNKEIELEKIRVRNERDAHHRRMGAENIKLITGIVTAAVTLAGLYVKFRGGQKS